MVIQFFKDAISQFFDSKKVWLPFFPFFLVLNFVMLSVEKAVMRESNQQFALQVFLIVLLLFGTAILTIRFISFYEDKKFSLGEYTIGSITFFMYNIFYLLIMVFGIILFILPGIVAGIFLFLAPIIALRENNVNAFKRSFYYLRKHWSLAAALFFVSIFFEVWGYFLSVFDGSPWLIYYQLIFSLVDTFFSLLLVGVVVYLYRFVCLKDSSASSQSLTE